MDDLTKLLIELGVIPQLPPCQDNTNLRNLDIGHTWTNQTTDQTPMSRGKVDSQPKTPKYTVRLTKSTGVWVLYGNVVVYVLP